MSPIDALAGTAAADNLLILSLGSRKLIEVTRIGVIKSTYDLSGVLANNAIEGVTVDDKGTIYLVAEQIQDGVIPLNPKSQLIEMTPPISAHRPSPVFTNSSNNAPLRSKIETTVAGGG